MKLVNKETGESVTVSDAGGKALLERGTHELPAKPKTTSTKKAAAKAEPEATEE